MVKIKKKGGDPARTQTQNIQARKNVTIMTKSLPQPENPLSGKAAADGSAAVAAGGGIGSKETPDANKNIRSKETVKNV
uniref:Uncharacterized protein n=1 Tax=Panagrolaimus davidi TaxID=227884 RepID=A0A914Q549_9BILA